MFLLEEGAVEGGVGVEETFRMEVEVPNAVEVLMSIKDSIIVQMIRMGGNQGLTRVSQMPLLVSE